MELWTRTAGAPEWRHWPSVIEGLTGLLDGRPEEVLLLSDAPDRERDVLAGALRLIRRLAGEDLRLVVASPHPSREWIEPLRPFGIAQVWAVDRRRNGPARDVDRASRVGDRVCPALHAKTEAGVTLSVCGRCGDRMVLARHHLERWCLTHREDCPHWRR